jgi:hypothetical protein
MIVKLRAWFSGRTGPCQGSDGSPILPARTPKSFIQLINCSHGEMDITTVFGTVIVGSSPTGGAKN